MEKTYNLILNHVKKGSLIKFNNENPIYRILSLSPDGTAEIFPVNLGEYVSPAWYNGFGSWLLPTAISYIGSTRNQQNEYRYCFADPISRQALPDGEQQLQGAPFYNYLQTANVEQTVWTTFEPKDNYSGTWFKITDDPLSIYDHYYYKLSLNVANTGTYHWRPLTLDDILDYYNKTSITSDEFKSIFNARGSVGKALSSNSVTSSYSTDPYNQATYDLSTNYINTTDS